MHRTGCGIQYFQPNVNSLITNIMSTNKVLKLTGEEKVKKDSSLQVSSHSHLFAKVKNGVENVTVTLSLVYVQYIGVVITAGVGW